MILDSVIAFYNQSSNLAPMILTIYLGCFITMCNFGISDTCTSNHILLCTSSFLSRNQTGKFSYAYSSFKGKRASMEDFYETRISEVDGQMVAFFGVFDGRAWYRFAI